jgi:hypothetical protein
MMAGHFARRRSTVPWCHTCRVEYPFELDACPECEGFLTDAPAPERRSSAINGDGLVVLTTLPPEQALLAAGRLDANHIPNALRDAGAGVELMQGAVDVLVSGLHLSVARDVLRPPRGRRGARRKRSRPIFAMYVLIATATALFLSAAVFVGRWLLTGSPVR